MNPRLKTTLVSLNAQPLAQFEDSENLVWFHRPHTFMESWILRLLRNLPKVSTSQVFAVVPSYFRAISQKQRDLEGATILRLINRACGDARKSVLSQFSKLIWFCRASGRSFVKLENLDKPSLIVCKSVNPAYTLYMLDLVICKLWSFAMHLPKICTCIY